MSAFVLFLAETCLRYWESSRVPAIIIVEAFYIFLAEDIAKLDFNNGDGGVRHITEAVHTTFGQENLLSGA